MFKYQSLVQSPGTKSRQSLPYGNPFSFYIRMLYYYCIFYSNFYSLFPSNPIPKPLSEKLCSNLASGGKKSDGAGRPARNPTANQYTVPLPPDC